MSDTDHVGGNGAGHENGHVDADRLRAAMIARGRDVLDDARTSFFVVVGAGDRGFEWLGSMSRDPRAQLERLRSAAGELPDRASELSTRLVQLMPPALKEALVGCGATARATYASYAVRGEQLLDRLRHEVGGPTSAPADGLDTDPAQPEPAQSEPAQPEPAQSDPAQAEHAQRGADQSTSRPRSPRRPKPESGTPPARSS